MMGGAHWLPGSPGTRGGWTIYPPLSAIESVVIYDASSFVEFVLPFVTGYWITWMVIYFWIARSNSIGVENKSGFVHFLCATIGVGIIIFLNDGWAGEANELERKVRIYDGLISRSTKIGVVFIFLGMIVGIAGIRRNKIVA